MHCLDPMLSENLFISTYHAARPRDNVVDDNVTLLLKTLQLGATDAQLLSQGTEEGLHDGDTDVGEGNDPEADNVQIVQALGVARNVPGLALDCELVLDRVRQMGHLPADAIAEERSKQD